MKRPDPYREWTYQDRCNARYDRNELENVERYDRDSESAERAYEQYRKGGEFSDPDPDGRFH